MGIPPWGSDSLGEVWLTPGEFFASTNGAQFPGCRVVFALVPPKVTKGSLS